MDAPLISCIVPVYNGERYIGEALHSILEQTYHPTEIIVADDGSTDGTAKVAEAFGNRVKYVHQTNQGYPEAKNLGLNEARGEFIAFLDADDLWHPVKLERQMARFAEPAPIDLCFTRFKNFWMPELAEEERFYQRQPLCQPQSAWSISTLLTRRAVFDRFGDFHDGTRGIENMTWFLRAAGQGAVIEVLSDILMDRRFNVESFTRRGKAVLFDNFLPILKEWKDYQRRKANG
jgi:glycosyltransferase involved in cell wall biosynthesis